MTAPIQLHTVCKKHDMLLFKVRYRTTPEIFRTDTQYIEKIKCLKNNNSRKTLFEREKIYQGTIGICTHDSRTKSNETETLLFSNNLLK